LYIQAGIPAAALLPAEVSPARDNSQWTFQQLIARFPMTWINAASDA